MGELGRDTLPVGVESCMNPRIDDPAEKRKKRGGRGRGEVGEGGEKRIGKGKIGGRGYIYNTANYCYYNCCEYYFYEREGRKRESASEREREREREKEREKGREKGRERERERER